ncbi:uncharacterized protein [Choristoneura fumiferana]|uniref:uncharacterized protein n=1 Tax=Choristoneura fumiferana TaxID=7141 RepID=UPI003D155012
MGAAPMASISTNHIVALHCSTNLDATLTKFWETEEAPSKSIQDPEDLKCEKHFVETHTRDKTGRFIVRLPFQTECKPLGETRNNALKRFHNLERKLIKDPRLKKMYVAFMADYLQAGHMRPASGLPSSDRYFIPHHGVLKESSSTTKLRAVFDASAASSSGVSLNQVLMSGPKLQQNIEDIILRFRTHAVVFTCDIKQMYRQVRMHDEDCKYQTIYWRESPDKPLQQQFELTTVTYGVSSAAYLAMRVIHELATLNKELHPEAARVLSEDTFVDDVISGSSDVESARALQQQIVTVLAQGGFQLRKWPATARSY